MSSRSILSSIAPRSRSSTCCVKLEGRARTRRRADANCSSVPFETDGVGEILDLSAIQLLQNRRHRCVLVDITNLTCEFDDLADLVAVGLDVDGEEDNLLAVLADFVVNFGNAVFPTTLANFWNFPPTQYVGPLLILRLVDLLLDDGDESSGQTRGRWY